MSQSEIDHEGQANTLQKQILDQRIQQHLFQKHLDALTINNQKNEEEYGYDEERLFSLINELNSRQKQLDDLNKEFQVDLVKYREKAKQTNIYEDVEELRQKEVDDEYGQLIKKKISILLDKMYVKIANNITKDLDPLKDYHEEINSNKFYTQSFFQGIQVTYTKTLNQIKDEVQWQEFYARIDRLYNKKINIELKQLNDKIKINEKIFKKEQRKRIFNEKKQQYLNKIKDLKQAEDRKKRHEIGDFSDEKIQSEEEESEDEIDEYGNIIPKNPDDYYYEGTNQNLFHQNLN